MKKKKGMQVGAGRRTGHLAPTRADYVQAFAGVNFNTEKISGAHFEFSGALSEALKTLKFSGPLLEVS